ncbi:MAG: hypothetical protein RLY31_1665 [Bacteroidota bacterium]|jgi:drug/metabolite transporter (DMT)-like permease
MHPETIRYSSRWLIPLSFAIIYIVWGSTYLANWYVIQDIPPMITTGSRYLMAGILLVALQWRHGIPNVSARQWRNAVVSGFMLLSVGTGCLVWAVQYIPSSLLALMVAFQPLLVLLLMWSFYGKRPNTMGVMGTVLGIVGMFILVSQEQLVANEMGLPGMAAVLVSLLSWGVASVRMARLDMPASGFLSSGIQMMVGGSLLLLVAVPFGEYRHLTLDTIASRSLYAWLYLVVFGSVAAFSAFNYLLKVSTPEKVASASYINPVVAMLLGWGLNQEQISLQSLVSSLFLLSGVFIINTNYRK